MLLQVVNTHLLTSEYAPVSDPKKPLVYASMAEVVLEADVLSMLSRSAYYLATDGAPLLNAAA